MQMCYSWLLKKLKTYAKRNKPKGKITFSQVQFRKQPLRACYTREADIFFTKIIKRQMPKQEKTTKMI